MINTPLTANILVSVLDFAASDFCCASPIAAISACRDLEPIPRPGTIAPSAFAIADTGSMLFVDRSVESGHVLVLRYQLVSREKEFKPRVGFEAPNAIFGNFWRVDFVVHGH